MIDRREFFQYIKVYSGVRCGVVRGALGGTVSVQVAE